MKESIINHVLQLRVRESELKQYKKDQYDKYVLEADNELQETQMELADAENSVLSAMEKENIKTYRHGDSNITYTTRKTLGIVDEDKVLEQLTTNADLLKKASKTIGLRAGEIKKKAVIEVLNRPFAKDIADSLLKVDGITLEGTEVKETKYLTIKEN